ncbi:MAG: carboxypeptidase-like regulatory domain-containing protein [Ignavibacteriae bacterium]|nr:carboxypeptidase-like regulatory domain-containing protein [Ignavibacteriota bacterium]
MSEILIGGTIKGTIKDLDSKEPLEYVSVVLIKTEFGTITDSLGFYEIKNLPIGKYKLTIPTMFYPKYEKDIIIDSINQIVNLDIDLKKFVPFIPIDTEIEKYHSKLTKFLPSEILRIHLDSIKYINNVLYVFSTFENQSDFPIYVIKTIDCIVMSYINIENEEIGKKPIHKLFYDCLGMKTIPDSTDFIEIFPHSKTEYSPIDLDQRLFRNDSKTYEITLTYEYKRKEKITGQLFTGGAELFNRTYKDAFYFYNMAFRGKVESSNYLTFSLKYNIEKEP